MAQPDQMPRTCARTQRRAPDQVSGGVLMPRYRMKSHFWWEARTPRRTRCECSDPGCPVKHGSKDCGKRTAGKVYRVDMEDRTGTAMCNACLEDAMDSGVFTTEESR